MAERQKTALVLSAGAPHSPLMAGWLYALLEKDKGFEIIHTSGAGAVIGLLSVAPKAKRPEEPKGERPIEEARDLFERLRKRLEEPKGERAIEEAKDLVELLRKRLGEPKAKRPIEESKEALWDIVEALGVADPIYALLSLTGFPIGYKTFFKPGPFTRPFQRWGKLFKLRKPGESLLAPIEKPQTQIGKDYNAWIEELMTRGDGSFKRFWNDLVDFWVAALTPTMVTPFSKGVCAPLPFLEDLVDFDKLRKFRGHFCVNAYNVTDGKNHMEVFHQDQITPDHVRAALAYPFIYPPGRIKGKAYFEGADRDPIWFGRLLEKRDEWGIKNVVLVDILGELEGCLIRPPRNLWDAYEMAILTPVCALANKEIRHFTEVLKGQHDIELYRAEFKIPEKFWPYITDWSYSNMSEMWRIGREAGRKFCETEPYKSIADRLPAAADLLAGQ